MYRRLITNAISVGMFDAPRVHAFIVHLSEEQAKRWYSQGPVESIVGHADIAALISDKLGTPVAMRRETTSLVGNESILVCAYTGPRLPEGCKSLPEGAKMRWMLVTTVADIT